MTSFNYDPYGNMITSAETFNSGTTAYTYDLGDRLTKISPPASLASPASYTLDALGRIATETVGSTTTTLSYVGTSKTASRLSVGTTNIDALLGADGSRLATLSGSSFGWLTPDLPGDVAGASSASFATISDALRYDAFGTIAAATTSALPTPWRYQGQLLIDPAGASDLYVDGARYYAPGLGAFTQLDTSAGQALNPLSMNRYLYSEANPATFTDPSGHVTIDEGDAYNSTLTIDATHHHTVTRHLSGKQMYPGYNWKAAEATFLKERRAQLAGDAAHARQVGHTGEAGIEAQDAASAGAAAERNAGHDGLTQDQADVRSFWGGIADRQGDNGPSSGDGMDVNGNPVSGMCAAAADVAKCDSDATFAPNMHDGLADISDKSGAAALALTVASLVPSPLSPVLGATAGVLGLVSIVTGIPVAVADCTSSDPNQARACPFDFGGSANGVASYGLKRVVRSRFGVYAAKGFDLGDQVFGVLWSVVSKALLR